MVALYDELWSGIAVVGAPGVEEAQGVGHAGYAWWVFALPTLIAASIEGPIALWSDRLSRERLLSVTLVVLGLSLALSGLAPKPWLLSLGLALAGAASGVACASAQAELVMAHAGRAERAMARWTAFAAAGDALAPPIVAAALWAGGSYRAALLLVAGLVAIQATAAASRARFSTPDPEVEGAADEGDERPAPLRELLARPRLWALMLGATSCLLLDEVVVALVALRMTRDLGASEAVTTASLSLSSLGGLAGALLMEALVARTSPRALLALSACASGASLGLVIAVRSPAQALCVLFLLGASTAPNYALLKAAAYDAAPGRPGVVNAIAQLYVGLELALPLAVGFVAARYGLSLALASLALEPLLVLIVALTLLRGRGAR